MRNYKKLIQGIILTCLMISIIFGNITVSSLNTTEANNNNQDSSVKQLKVADAFIPPPDPDNQNFVWDFNNGTIKAFHWVMAGSEGGLFGTSYYNITSMPYLFNQTGMDTWEYCVQVQELYYNTTLKTHLPHYLNPYPLNVSLLNLTIPYFYPIVFPSEEEEEEDGFDPSRIFTLNAFIPSNGTGNLAFNWSAKQLKLSYQMIPGFGLIDEEIIDDTNRNMYFRNTTTGAFVNLTYGTNGILTSGKMSFLPEGDWVTLSLKVDDNLNPIDEIEWAVEEGDELYYGFNRNEVRFNITRIENETIIIPQAGLIIAAQTIWANMSRWIYEPGMYIGWVDQGEIGIGCANEAYPYIPFFQPLIPIVFPKNYDMSLVAQLVEMVNEDVDQVTYGSNWINMFNSTTQGFTKYTYNVSGILELIDSKNLQDFMGEEEFAVWYLKNSTIINTGIHVINIRPLGTNVVNTTLSISVNGDTHLLYSAFNVNPINITLNYGILYVDVWVNDTSKLGINAVNLTFEFDPKVYKKVEVWYFNTSSNDPNEAWKQLPYDVIASGKIVVRVNHTSIFVFTNIPLSKIIGGGDDDDDDDEETAQIPFGNSYLIFLAIGVIGLILYTKRKFKN